MDTAQYESLWEEIKAYLNTRYDLLRLSVLEKASRIVGMILLALVMVLLLWAVLAMGGLALVFVLAQYIPTWAACLIIGAIFICLMILAWVFRKQWFINPMIVALSAILFAPSDKLDAPAKKSTDEEKGDEKL